MQRHGLLFKLLNVLSAESNNTFLDDKLQGNEAQDKIMNMLLSIVKRLNFANKLTFSSDSLVFRLEAMRTAARNYLNEFSLFSDMELTIKSILKLEMYEVSISRRA